MNAQVNREAAVVGSNVPRWHAALTSIIQSKEETDTAPLKIILTAEPDQIARWPERDAAVKKVAKQSTNGKTVMRNVDAYKEMMLETAIGKELDGQLKQIIDTRLNGPEAMARKDTLRRKISYGVETMKRAKDCTIAMSEMHRLGFTAKIDSITGKASKSFRPFFVADTEGRTEYFSVPQLVKSLDILKAADMPKEIRYEEEADGKVIIHTNVQHLKAALAPNRDAKGGGNGDDKAVNFKNWKADCLPAIQGLVNFFDDDARVERLTKSKIEQEAYDELFTLHEKLTAVLNAQAKLGMAVSVQEPAAPEVHEEPAPKAKRKAKGEATAH